MMYFFFKPGWLLEQIEQSNDHSRPNLLQVRKMEGIYQNLLLISQLINNYHLNIDLEVIIQLEKELIAYRTFNDTLMNQLTTPPILSDSTKDPFYMLRYFSYLREECIQWTDPYLKSVITINIQSQHIHLSLPQKIQVSVKELHWLLNIYNQHDCVEYIIKRTRLSQIMYFATHFVKEMDVLIKEFFQLHKNIIHQLQMMKENLWFFQSNKQTLLERLIDIIKCDHMVCINGYRTQLNLLQIDWFSFAYSSQYELHIQNTWHLLNSDAQLWIRHHIMTLLKQSLSNPYTLSYLDLIMIHSSMNWFEFEDLKNEIIYLFHAQKEVYDMNMLTSQMRLDFIDHNSILYLNHEEKYSEQALTLIQKLVCMFFWHHLQLGPWSQQFDQQHLRDLQLRVKIYQQSTSKNWMLRNSLGEWVLSWSQQGEYTDAEIINQIYFPQKSQPTLLWLWLYQTFNPSIDFWIHQMIAFSAVDYFDQRYVVEGLDHISDGQVSKALILYGFEHHLFIDWLIIFYQKHTSLIDQLVLKLMDHLIQDEHFTMETVILNAPVFKKIIEGISSKISYNYNDIKSYSTAKLDVMFDLFCHRLQCVPIEYCKFVLNQYVIFKLSSLKTFDFLDHISVWFKEKQLLIEDHALFMIQRTISFSIQLAFEHTLIQQWLVIWFKAYRDLDWDPIFQIILCKLYQHRFDIGQWIADLPVRLSEIVLKTHSVITINPLVYYMIFYQLLPPKVCTMLFSLYERFKDHLKMSECSKVMVSIDSKDKNQMVIWNHLSFFEEQEEEVCLVAKSINQV